jgi:hypothetical protein
MSNEGENWAPAVWDPTANGGAGGWVRRHDTGTQRIRPPEPPAGEPGAGAAPRRDPERPGAGGAAPVRDSDTGPEPGPAPTADLRKPPVPPGPRPTAPDAPAPPAWPPVGPTPPGQYAQPPFGPPAASDPETQVLPPVPPGGPAQPDQPPPPYPPTARHSAPPVPPLLPQAPDHLARPPAFPPFPPGQAPQVPPARPGHGGPDGGQPEPYPFFQPEPPGQDLDIPGGGGRKVWIAVLVAAVLVGALVFGAVWVLGSGGGKGHHRAARSPHPSVSHRPTHGTGGGTPSPSPSQSSASSAQDQAKALDDLLDESAADRKKVSGAVRDVDTCASGDAVGRAENDLNDAADHRDSLVDRLDRLELDQVEGGAEAVADLRAAWQDSADADRAFASWASSMASGGCTPGGTGHDGDYDRGIDSSQKAQQAKEDFVDKWNPIADEQGLEERSADAL